MCYRLPARLWCRLLCLCAGLCAGAGSAQPPADLLARAERHAQQQRWPAAHAALDEAAAAWNRTLPDPGDLTGAALYTLRTAVALHLGLPPTQAAQYHQLAQDLLDMAPPSPRRATLQRRLAQAALDLADQHPPAAARQLAHYRTAAAAHPDSEFIHLALAHLLEAQQPDDALRVYEEFLLRQPRSVSAHIMLGRFCGDLASEYHRQAQDALDARQPEADSLFGVSLDLLGRAYEAYRVAAFLLPEDADLAHMAAILAHDLEDRPAMEAYMLREEELRMRKP